MNIDIHMFMNLPVNLSYSMTDKEYIQSIQLFDVPHIKTQSNVQSEKKVSFDHVFSSDTEMVLFVSSYTCWKQRNTFYCFW